MIVVGFPYHAPDTTSLQRLRRLRSSLGLRQPRDFGATRGARGYLLISVQRVGQMPPGGLAGGRGVLAADRFVDRNMLRLNPAQISDALRVAAARDIENLAGNDEIPEELKKLLEVAIMNAAKNRQMEPEVGINRVAADFDFGLDRP